MILEMPLPRLHFELVSFFLRQLVEPLRLNKLVDLPAELMRVLIFEHIEVLILKNLVSSRCSSWSNLLKFLNLVLKTLDQILVLLTQVTHVVWVSIDDNFVVLSHQGG